MPLSSYAKDTFVGPYMSTFTAAEIPDMSDHDPQQEHWISIFILNTMFRVKLPQSDRQYMFNFLRRAEAAFREYALAREQTLLFLSLPDSPSHYIAAITYWEDFLSQAWISFDLLRKLAHVPKGSLFKKGEDTVLERLNSLHSLSKHATDEAFPDDATLVIWLRNNGIHSKRTHLTFDEMANDILKELARWADRMQDPLTFNEKIKAAAEK